MQALGLVDNADVDHRRTLSGTLFGVLGLTAAALALSGAPAQAQFASAAVATTPSAPLVSPEYRANFIRGVTDYATASRGTAAAPLDLSKQKAATGKDELGIAADELTQAETVLARGWTGAPEAQRAYIEGVVTGATHKIDATLARAAVQTGVTLPNPASESNYVPSGDLATVQRRLSNTAANIQAEDGSIAPDAHKSAGGKLLDNQVAAHIIPFGAGIRMGRKAHEEQAQGTIRREDRYAEEIASQVHLLRTNYLSDAPAGAQTASIDSPSGSSAGLTEMAGVRPGGQYVLAAGHK